MGICHAMVVRSETRPISFSELMSDIGRLRNVIQGPNLEHKAVEALCAVGKAVTAHFALETMGCSGRIF